MPQPLSRQRWPGVWRGHSLRRSIPALPSGHAALDHHLPGHGWPLGALSELLTETPGSGEFSLLLPALADLSTRGQWVVLLDPPWIPYPPAMLGHGIALERIMLIRTSNRKESLWACEQVLRDGRGGAVLAWHADLDFARLRRLQLAAKDGYKAAFLFRPPQAGHQASPATLRLGLQADPHGTRITVLKCQGRRPDESFLIRRSQYLPGLPNQASAPDSRPLPALPPADGKQPVTARPHVH
jgi:hypothetical protein